MIIKVDNAIIFYEKQLIIEYDITEIFYPYFLMREQKTRLFILTNLEYENTNFRRVYEIKKCS